MRKKVSLRTCPAWCCTQRPSAADEERVFLISEELEFRSTTTSEGEACFVWRDLEGDVDEFYEFVSPGTNGATQAFFETCMYRAMYERKYRKSADDTTDAELEEFIRKSVLYSIVCCCVPLNTVDLCTAPHYQTFLRPGEGKGHRGRTSRRNHAYRSF